MSGHEDSIAGQECSRDGCNERATCGIREGDDVAYYCTPHGSVAYQELRDRDPLLNALHGHFAEPSAPLSPQ